MKMSRSRRNRLAILAGCPALVATVALYGCGDDDGSRPTKASLTAQTKSAAVKPTAKVEAAGRQVVEAEKNTLVGRGRRTAELPPRKLRSRKRLKAQPPRDARRRSSRLRAAPGLRRGRAIPIPGQARRAQASATYSFSVRSGWSARCGYIPYYGGSKSIYVEPPNVLAKDHSSQYVYWRAVLWDANTYADVWVGEWRRGIAYTSYYAQFPVVNGSATEGTTLYGTNSSRTIAAETDVYWYSPVYGWHLAYVGAQATLISSTAGFVTVAAVC
jgi:hypothetical protein